jgi:hypothetical protein
MGQVACIWSDAYHRSGPPLALGPNAEQWGNHLLQPAARAYMSVNQLSFYFFDHVHMHRISSLFRNRR